MTFRQALPHERPIFDAVHGYVRTLGPIHVEPVSVGIFLKAGGSFIELRPKTQWVAMSFPLSRRASHPRITRKRIVAGFTLFHIANLRDPADLDDGLRELLAESYDYAS